MERGSESAQFMKSVVREFAQAAATFIDGNALQRRALASTTGQSILPVMADRGNILDDPVAKILLSGQAASPSEAERIYLEQHLDDVFQLVESPLSEDEFRRHPLIAMLFSHGSRAWEDSLR